MFDLESMLWERGGEERLNWDKVLYFEMLDENERICALIFFPRLKHPKDPSRRTSLSHYAKGLEVLSCSLQMFKGYG